MKKVILGLAIVLAINTVAVSAFACTLTPAGDTRLRIEALLNAIDEMESLQALTADMDTYHVVTYNHSTLESETRSYQLINTSAMCPIYEAREIK